VRTAARRMTFAGAIASLPIALAAAAAAATYLGGRIALRLETHISLILGATAGVVLGIALFGLLPEALEAAAGRLAPRTLFAAMAGGMMTYLMLDRLLERKTACAAIRPHLGPAALTVHSFIDGVGIALGFDISVGVGVAVAGAVLAHDLADGANAVGLSLAAGRRDIAHRWLLINSSAPLAGVLISGVLQPGAAAVSLFLAAFAGLFLYIGTCQLIPRSQAKGHQLCVAVATACGMIFSFGVIGITQII